jgi:hypothetical protein
MNDSPREDKALEIKGDAKNEGKGLEVILEGTDSEESKDE